MLEAEALWSREEAVPERRASRFVQLSGRQVEVLQQHHRLMLAQHVGHVRGKEEQGVEEATAVGALKTLGRRHHAQAGRRPGPPSSLAITGLSRLDSQYVGPVGVGTVRSPAGCTTMPGRSLLYLSTTEGNSTSLDQRRVCHLQDESNVWVVLDTGSTNIWVNSDLCNAGACAKTGRKRYDHSHSVTYRQPKDPVILNIEFGTGKVSGPQAVDDFHVGPFTVKHQTFGMIQEQEGRVFEEVPFEGILGLAFPKMSANGVTPFFDNIIQQKVLRNNSFSFYFSLDNPSANAVFWGGADHHFYEGDIEYFRVSDPFYWSIPLISFQVGGQELLGQKVPTSEGASSWLQRAFASPSRTPKAIVDTGTTFFTAEGALFDEVMRRLPSAPCDQVSEQSHPPLTYRLQNAGGQPSDFVLSNQQYMTQSVGSGNNLCSPAFMKINIPPKHGPAMVLGEVFLRHFYSIFDRGDGREGQARVGFARAAHGNEVVKYLRSLTKHQPPFQAAHQPAA